MGVQAGGYCLALLVSHFTLGACRSTEVESVFRAREFGPLGRAEMSARGFCEDFGLAAESGDDGPLGGVDVYEVVSVAHGECGFPLVWGKCLSGVHFLVRFCLNGCGSSEFGGPGGTCTYPARVCVWERVSRTGVAGRAVPRVHAVHDSRQDPVSPPGARS